MQLCTCLSACAIYANFLLRHSETRHHSQAHSPNYRQFSQCQWSSYISRSDTIVRYHRTHAIYGTRSKKILHPHPYRLYGYSCGVTLFVAIYREAASTLQVAHHFNTLARFAHARVLTTSIRTIPRTLHSFKRVVFCDCHVPLAPNSHCCYAVAKHTGGPNSTFAITHTIVAIYACFPALMHRRLHWR